MCKVEGCKTISMYKKGDVCQKHYFRFMRNGTYEKIKARRYRIQNPAGYQLIFEPAHKLSQKNGYIYEHRFVAYMKYGDNLPCCELCKKECSWACYTTHIDHIDNDVTNNKPDNLRPLCNSCNSRRDLPPQHKRVDTHKIEYNGLIMTAAEWSRYEGVKVRGNTIVSRLSKGLSVYDALFSKRKTHNSND